jgi:hypothetical protein
LRFDAPLARIFGGGKARMALVALRPALRRPTRRLAVASTVDACARKAGFFQPVYRSKRLAPVYLLLVRQLDRDDHRAALAEELARHCGELGVAARCYRFRDDPRWLRPWDSKTGTAGEPSSLARLAAEYGEAGLLVFSEAAILFHPLTGEPRAWLKDFAPWERRVWLHERDAGPVHAELLRQNQFLALPLESAQLPTLAAWLRTDGARPGQPPPSGRAALPEAIADEADAWLSPYPPYGADLARLHWELHWYLGTRGLLLLQALTVYPAPHWQLTQALDYLLFAEQEKDAPERRERRLARLARLPWLRHAHFPEYLREDLLRRAAPDELETVRAAWGRLFGQLTGHARPGRLRLDLAAPQRKTLRRRLAELRAGGRAGALDDPIFAHILLGGRLGLWDFRIPQAIARKLPGGRRLADARPLLAALLLAAGGAYAALWAWAQGGQDWLQKVWETRVQAENACCLVHLRARPQTGPLAQALRETLPEQGFKLADAAASSLDAGERADAADPSASSRNRIVYPARAQAVAERLASQLRRFSYNADISLRADAGVQDLAVELAQAYAPGAAFNDALLHPYRKPFRDKLKQGGEGPEMIPLPPGEFLMGSQEDEPARDPDESPRPPGQAGPRFRLGALRSHFRGIRCLCRERASGQDPGRAGMRQARIGKAKRCGLGTRDAPGH